MSWFAATIIFLISWWIVFLLVLPIGTQNQLEHDQNMQVGTDPGAPVEHMLPKKALWALYGATAITVFAFLVAVSGIIQMPKAPWA